MVNWQTTISSILDLVSAPNCGLCDRPTSTPICPDCHTQLHSCHVKDDRTFWIPPLPLLSWGRYTGALRQGITTLKYNNQPQLARVFGQWLGQMWLASPMAKTSSGRSLIVVPVPANAAKKKRRGYDQSELLAQAFCQYTRLPLDLRCVVRIEDTIPMHGLSVTERQQNVLGKFRLHPQFNGKTSSRPFWHKPHTNQKILLLDDIYTTGSTLGAIAHLLRQHRLSVYGAVTLAKTNRAL
ncbi:MAG: ComF family protein [Merismopedia sp. SIO2A8]|nr:ComF family protein [Symploca sp. SIO2B6]NET52498.1 ComF family protein [Merismopedia sp. SIO2A8]